jgi:hypothetical protein
MESCKNRTIAALLEKQPTEVTEKREIEQEQEEVIDTSAIKTGLPSGVKGAEPDGIKCNTTTKPANLSGATKLRRMIEETSELIICPGVYDGLSARIAQRVGFSALYMVRFKLGQI